MGADNSHKVEYVNPILIGERIINPVYRQQELEEYEGNPYIEALPPIFDSEEVIDKCTYYPKVSKDENIQRTAVRLHMIRRLQFFVQPLTRYLDIEVKLSNLIRAGYIARNPCTADYLKRLDYINQVKIVQDDKKLDRLSELSKMIRSTASSFGVIGISGMGKTTSVEKLISMYPQTIIHTEYKGKPLTRTQIVWLKIDSPYDGSTKTLCQLFFKAIDDVLGTDYFRKYGNSRTSTSTMMIHMSYLASLYGIGVLVIDELQHMIKQKNESEVILSFLVTLINTVGIPTVLIGTPKALNMLSSEFKQARRVFGEGSIIWDRMKEDSEEWDFFLNVMWDFQWLKTDTLITDELKTAMYFHSQGITHLAVSLFTLVQQRALRRDEENITVKLIDSVAQNELKGIQPILDALRIGNENAIDKYKDISIKLNEIVAKHIDTNPRLLEEMLKRIEKARIAREEAKLNISEGLLIELKELDILTHLSDNQIENIIGRCIKKMGSDEEDNVVLLRQMVFKDALKENEKVLKEQKQLDRKSRPNNLQLEEDDLRALFKKAQDMKISPYEVLEQNGVIKNAFEFL